jgi:hypothetical protein
MSVDTQIESQEPQASVMAATVCTQVIKSNQIVDKSPPNPHFWGSRTLQSPPELGDLGG